VVTDALTEETGVEPTPAETLDPSGAALLVELVFPQATVVNRTTANAKADFFSMVDALQEIFTPNSSETHRWAPDKSGVRFDYLATRD
jgi:hypothetical protein